jgi:phage shock protein E
MKILLMVALAVAVFLILQRSLQGQVLSVAESLKRMQAGAVLVDVREPSEWRGGVAADAILLPMSDLNGGRSHWKPFLEHVGKDREILLYCRSGNRSGIVARQLAREGFRVANAGAFSAWSRAGKGVDFDAQNVGSLPEPKDTDVDRAPVRAQP